VDADDLYQETWLKVCQKIDQYDPSFAFEGWLTRICVNTYRDQWRRKSISRIFDSFESREAKDALLANTPAPEKSDHTDLHHAVQKLPEKLRLTVLTYYFQDLDADHTAQALGIPIGTVKSRLHKARLLLKEMMKNEIEL
jgi:RNA polymerase sigma-70 factor (ECF subfamily)